MAKITFGNPAYLYLMLILLPLIGWYIYRHRTIFASMHFSGTARFGEGFKNYKYYLKHVPFILRVIALGLLIAALARPQSVNRWKNVATEGIDIMIALDISNSMTSLDFNPDRIGAAKAYANEFISGRPNDRLGLVVFGAESFTQCPLTSDHAAVINLMREVKIGMIDDAKTAIGLGLANAVNRLKDSKSASKVIILLTDGVNNSGSIAPLTAAEIAKNFGIRVYCIGVGTQGTAKYPVHTQFGIQYVDVEVEIDEEVLGKIALLTGGKYFRATDNEKLRGIYREIDKLEKSKVETKEYSKKQEEYEQFAIAALIVILFELFLSLVILRNIP
jgi:Ca-activated chloride channel family protein